MDKKTQSVDFSYINLFKFFSNIYYVFLLIFGIFLFDSLEIMVFQKGILDTDFSDFLNLSNIPFFLLFLTVFGIILSVIHVLADYFTSKLYDYIFYKKYKKRKDFNDINSLYENTLLTENSFLFKYIKKEIVIVNNTKRKFLNTYLLLCVIILNLTVTFIYNSNTLMKFIINLYTNNDDIFIKIFSTILIALVFITIIAGIKYSISQYQFEIYFPDAKYQLLDEEKKSLLDKK